VLIAVGSRAQTSRRFATLKINQFLFDSEIVAVFIPISVKIPPRN
jgi:hypothetical protein